MKYNLNNIANVLIASLLLTAISCNKYLDQQPITSVGPDMVFKDVTSARGALASVYQQLTGDMGYGLRLSLYIANGSDETQGPTGSADAGRRDFPLYATTPSNTQINGNNNPYNQIFRGIQYANTCIANIPTMASYNGGSDNEKKQLRRMLGEALTLRAQFYFEAIRNWGDLPAHFEAAEVLATKDPFPRRTDRDTLYERLLSDLKTASDLVPWRNEVAAIGDDQDERITKGVVKGLRARIALFRGGFSLRQDGTLKRGSNYQFYYQIARTETQEIIASNQHTLNPSYLDLWKNQVGSRVVNDPHGELMFQVTGIGKTASTDTKIGFYNGPTVIDGTASSGTSGVFILPTYFYLFDSLDTRRDVTCAAFGDTVATDGVTFYKRGAAITGIFDGKFRRSWLKPTIARGAYGINFAGAKWQILRYSDVLLMFAEAENELNGPTAAAYNALNVVRRRGFGKSVNTTDATVDLSGLGKDDFQKAIVRERSLELGGEGVRKYDLIRWNKLADAINETKANLVRMGALTNMLPTTYMASPPSYVMIAANLPSSMFFRRTTSDDLSINGGMVVNSLYSVAPTSTPAGTTRVNWVTSAISTGTSSSVTLNHFANNFQTLKSELLPIPIDAITAYGGFAANMPQNPGY
jgi:hypothetical protein